MQQLDVLRTIYDTGEIGPRGSDLPWLDRTVREEWAIRTDWDFASKYFREAIIPTSQSETVGSFQLSRWLRQLQALDDDLATSLVLAKTIVPGMLREGPGLTFLELLRREVGNLSTLDVYSHVANVRLRRAPRLFECVPSSVVWKTGFDPLRVLLFMTFGTFRNATCASDALDSWFDFPEAELLPHCWSRSHSDFKAWLTACDLLEVGSSEPSIQELDAKAFLSRICSIFPLANEALASGRWPRQLVSIMR